MNYREKDWVTLLVAAAIVAAVFFVAVWFVTKEHPTPAFVDDTVVVPISPPVATGGQGEEPSTNQPQPVYPPDVVPINPPVATGGRGEEPSASQPGPVYPKWTPPTHNPPYFIPPEKKRPPHKVQPTKKPCKCKCKHQTHKYMTGEKHYFRPNGW